MAVNPMIKEMTESNTLINRFIVQTLLSWILKKLYAHTLSAVNHQTIFLKKRAAHSGP